MPDPTQTGYILLAMQANDNDEPTRPVENAIEDLLPMLRQLDIFEARAVFNVGDGSYRPYGPGYIA